MISGIILKATGLQKQDITGAAGTVLELRGWAKVEAVSKTSQFR